jgi:hypothetical protein
MVFSKISLIDEKAMPAESEMRIHQLTGRQAS